MKIKCAHLNKNKERQSRENILTFPKIFPGKKLFLENISWKKTFFGKYFYILLTYGREREITIT